VTTPRKKPEDLLKRGRKTAYRPEFVAQAEKLAAMGATDLDLATFFEVGITTVQRWMVAHPEFRGAVMKYKAGADDRVERSLYQRAVGYSHEAVRIFMPAGAKEPVLVPYIEHVPPDANAAKAWLMNRRPKQWREKIEVGGPDGGPIKVDHSGDIGIGSVLARHKPAGE